MNKLIFSLLLISPLIVISQTAEEKGYQGLFNKKSWLEENAKDVLYGKAQWFMAEDKVKRSRSIKTVSTDYQWVIESLSPEENWK